MIVSTFFAGCEQQDEALVENSTQHTCDVVLQYHSYNVIPCFSKHPQDTGSHILEPLNKSCFGVVEIERHVQSCVCLFLNHTRDPKFTIVPKVCTEEDCNVTFASQVDPIKITQKTFMIFRNTLSSCGLHSRGVLFQFVCCQLYLSRLTKADWLKKITPKTRQKGLCMFLQTFA